MNENNENQASARIMAPLRSRTEVGDGTLSRLPKPRPGPSQTPGVPVSLLRLQVRLPLLSRREAQLSRSTSPGTQAAPQRPAQGPSSLMAVSFISNLKLTTSISRPLNGGRREREVARHPSLRLYTLPARSSGAFAGFARSRPSLPVHRHRSTAHPAATTRAY